MSPRVITRTATVVSTSVVNRIVEDAMSLYKEHRNFPRALDRISQVVDTMFLDHPLYGAYADAVHRKLVERIGEFECSREIQMMRRMIVDARERENRYGFVDEEGDVRPPSDMSVRVFDESRMMR